MAGNVGDERPERHGKETSVTNEKMVVALRAGESETPQTIAPSAEERSSNVRLRDAYHDLCSPLGAIRLLLDLSLMRLRRGDDMGAAEVECLLIRVGQLVTHGIRIVDDALLSSPPPGRIVEDVAVEVDFEDVLASAISLQGEALRRAECDVIVTREGANGRIRGAWNERALTSLFSNLLQNASRHAAGAPVRVVLTHGSRYLHLRFADGGPGFRMRPMPTVSDGESLRHGLGLSIIWRAVAELDGDIELRTELGRGLVYEIRLPLPGSDGRSLRPPDQSDR
jgi:signal transduction histidine kinase